ncbi:MAG: hypothetical protein H2069_08860 [Legionella sp.]|nr:hypothetical protein [Legionella sp.]
MGSLTRLRLPAEFALTEQLEARLEAALGKFEAEYYSPKVDLLRSYQRRIDIIEQAMCFIAESTPLALTSSSLRRYLDWAKSNCSFPTHPKASIDEYQDALIQYTALVTNILCDFYPWQFAHQDPPIALHPDECSLHKKNTALQILNKAEQYILLLENRPNLATLVPLHPNPSMEFALLHEKPLAPYSKETLEDFLNIKKYSIQQTRSNLPDWFQMLSPALRRYLHHPLIEEYTPDELKIELNQFEIHWLRIKAEPNAAEQLSYINRPDPPEWFLALSPQHQLLLRILYDFTPCTLKNINAQLNESSLKLNEVKQRLAQKGSFQRDQFLIEVKAIKHLPYWFVALPGYEQTFLTAVLNRTDSLQSFLSSVPSRLRSIPALANGGHHQLFLSNSDDELKAFPVRYRSSHMASRDVKKDAFLCALHPARNLETFLNAWLSDHRSSTAETTESITLIQTLISPLAPLGHHYLPDPMLDRELKTIVHNLNKEQGGKIFFINHPLNLARHANYTKPNDPSCQRLLTFGKLLLLVKDIKIKPQNIHWDLDLIEKLVFETFNSLEGQNQSEQYQTDQNDSLLRTNETDNKETINELIIQDPDQAQMKFKATLKKLLTAKYYSLKIPDSWKSLLAKQLFLKKQSQEQGNDEAYNQRQKDLAILLDEYNDVLSLSYGGSIFYDAHGRELFLSSLEHLIITHLGGSSYGSCVSGKDRKGLETLHTDAMLIYREKYGLWPRFSDANEQRNNFVNLVSLLYVSRHAHEHAGQNVPGADGIKTPDNYWPADIANTIRTMAGSDILSIDDRLASNNELGHLEKKLIGYPTDLLDRIKPNFCKYFDSAQQLSEKNLVLLIDTLRILSGEKNYWTKPSSGFFLFASFQNSVPTGIQNIQKILQNPGNDYLSLVYKLASIYLEVKQRLTFCNLRASKTQDFYSAIARLFMTNDPEKESALTLTRLQIMKEMAFQANLEHQNTTTASYC